MSSISAEGAKLSPPTSQNQEVTLKGLKAKITLCLREKLSGAFRCLGQRVTATRERKITFPAAEERRGGRGALKRSRRSSCRRCTAAKNSGPCEVRKPPVKTSAAQSEHLTGATSRKKEKKAATSAFPDVSQRTCERFTRQQEEQSLPV